jgi:hypothetical protein
MGKTIRENLPAPMRRSVGRRSLRTIAIAAIVLFAPIFDAYPQKSSFSFSAPFLLGNASGYSPITKSALIRQGVTTGLSSRTEAELATVFAVTPRPLNDLFFDASVSYAILSPHFLSATTPTAFVNTLIGAGFAIGFHEMFSPFGATVSYHGYIKLTPLVVGSLFYGKRNRIGTIGAQYDFTTGQISPFLDLISIDISLVSPYKVR